MFQGGLPRRSAKPLKTSAPALIMRAGSVYDSGENGLLKKALVVTADQRAGDSAKYAASKYS